MAKILLLGLDSASQIQILSRIPVETHEIRTATELQGYVSSGGTISGGGELSASDLNEPDVLFLSADHNQHIQLLSHIRAYRPELPCIVVSRSPQTSEWLDSLEAGAADYCALPLEARQLRWMVDNALDHRPSLNQGSAGGVPKSSASQDVLNEYPQLTLSIPMAVGAF